MCQGLLVVTVDVKKIRHKSYDMIHHKNSTTDLSCNVETRSSWAGLSGPAWSLSLSESFSRSLSSDDEFSSLRWVSERMRLRRRFFLRAPDPAKEDPSGVSSGSSGTSWGIGEVQRCAGTWAWGDQKNKNQMLKKGNFFLQFKLMALNVRCLTSIFPFCSTKKASPLSPSFMCRSTDSPFISMSTSKQNDEHSYVKANRPRRKGN